MRVIGRRDTPLAIALGVGTIVMFAQPLRSALSVAEDVSRTYYVDLVPGLMIFVIVFGVHYWRKHKEAAVAVQAAERNVEAAVRAAADMEKLVGAAQAITNAVDSPQLRVEAWRHVPPIVGNRPVWIAVMAPHDWQWVIEPAGTAADAILELAPTLLRLAEAGDRRHNGWALFPLTSSGRALGLLSVHEAAPLTLVDESRIASLAVILSVAVKNVHLFEQMRVNSVTDALTGCFNRAHAFATLDSELRRSRRHKRPVSLVMLDIDGFKAINDERGHLCGDALLHAIGDTLGRTLRTSDVKCRYGGDEFLVILPDTPLDGAAQVAEHLRRAIERLEVSGPAPPVSCQISVGVAAATAGETDPVALVHRVDVALYHDKKRLPQGLRSISLMQEVRSG